MGERHRYNIRRRAAALHGVQIAPQERRLRCLQPAQPLPDDGGPYGEARRARRASPRPTPVLAAALFCLPHAAPAHTPDKMDGPPLRAGLRPTIARLSATAALRWPGLGLRCSGSSAWDVGRRVVGRMLSRRPYGSRRLVHRRRRTDLQGRPRTPRGPATAVWSIVPFSPPRTGQSRCGATLRARRVDLAGTPRQAQSRFWLCAPDWTGPVPRSVTPGSNAIGHKSTHSANSHVSLAIDDN